ATPVVEQSIDRFLKHALLVANDDLWSRELLQPLEAIVAVDDAPIEVVEIRAREPAAVERDERTKIRRKYRNHIQHHPLGLVSAVAEGLDHAQPLRGLLALGFTRRRCDL